MSMTAEQRQRAEEARATCARHIREQMERAALEVEQGADPLRAIGDVVARLHPNISFLVGVNGAASMAEGRRDEAVENMERLLGRGR